MNKRLSCYLKQYWWQERLMEKKRAYLRLTSALTTLQSGIFPDNRAETSWNSNNCVLTKFLFYLCKLSSRLAATDVSDETAVCLYTQCPKSSRWWRDGRPQFSPFSLTLSLSPPSRLDEMDASLSRRSFIWVAGDRISVRLLVALEDKWSTHSR